MSHFQLIDPDLPNVLVSQITKHGRGNFYVKPTSRNETLVPINGRATVNILGKKVNISLIHNSKSGEDPEPSVPKWSYFKELYSSYDPLTPVSPSLIKDIQKAYVFATAGLTSYSGSPTSIVSTTRLSISKPFTVLDEAKAQAPSSSDTYDYDSFMRLGRFRMFYKQSTIDPNTGDIIIPTDDDTPSSNRLRLPCKASIGGAPSWITDVYIKFCIDTYRASDPTIIDTTVYDPLYGGSWEDFRAAWDTIRANYQDYANVDFYYDVVGKVATNSDTTEVRPGSPNTITIQEIAGDNGRIWGAKPLYLVIGQLGGFKKIKLYYKKALSSEITVPGPSQVSPGSAQINNTHNLWYQGEACGVYTDEQGDDTITLNKLTGRGMGNDTAQDHNSLDFPDDQYDRTEYYYVGHPFFLGFVEETNLYKESIGINLFDGKNTKDFWHSLYFNGVGEKCSYDPEWFNLGEMPHIYQGSDPLSIDNIGYTILFPWAVKSGNSWKSLYEIPTAMSDEGLETNSHRILAINWVTKATENPALNKDLIKSTSDILYGGGVSIHYVKSRDKANGEGWNFNPDKVPTGSGENRLKNYLEYVAQQWDNNPTAFGTPSELRNVKEILFVPIYVTAHKLCPNDPIVTNNINAMAWGDSLIPEAYKDHEGYAPLIGIFPPTIESWY